MGNQSIDESGIDVPFLVRLKLLTGFRVPSAYREWAVSQIRAKSFPYRRAVWMLIFAWPAAFVGSFTPRLFGWGYYEGQYFNLLVYFPIVFVVVGLLVSTLAGKRIQAVALRKQLKDEPSS